MIRISLWVFFGVLVLLAIDWLLWMKDDFVGQTFHNATNQAQAQRPPTPPNTVILSRSNMGTSFSIAVYQAQDIVSTHILRSGWEMQHIHRFNQIFTAYSNTHAIPLSNLIFIDIGANIGWFTLSMAALGIQVLAFEPMHENLQLLRLSLSLPLNIENGIRDRVTLYPHGLGTKDEVCIIYSHDINVGDGHVQCVPHEDRVRKPADYSIRGRIPVHRLDDVLHTLINNTEKHIVAIKIDTEGYEANILQGGTETILHGGAEAILMEFDENLVRDKGGDPVKSVAMLAEAGYRVKYRGWSVLPFYLTKEQMIETARRNGFASRELRLYSEKYRTAHWW